MPAVRFHFVSKVLKINLIELATRVMLGLPVEKPHKNLFDLDYVGIKASQFSFNRLQKADPVLGVDMSSTGEVGCLGDDTSTALLKSMLSVGHRIPAKNILLSTGSAKQKVDLLDAAQMLVKHGYKLYATGGSSKFLTENGIENTRVLWPSEEAEGGAPKALEMLHNHEIDMVVNIPKNLTSSELSQWLQDSSCSHRPERAIDYQQPSGECFHLCILSPPSWRISTSRLGASINS